MLGRKIFSVFAALVFCVAAAVAVTATTLERDGKASAEKARVEAPLNLAILVQDDLVSRVGTELNVTRDFIRSLPAGSQVMVAYVTVGSLQVRQSFTTDLEKAAKSLRMPVGSTSASPYNPYVEVVEALKRFDAKGENRNALLLISDGLDTSRGFDIDSAANTIDLLHAIKEAQRRSVSVYSFYAPTVGLTSFNRLAVSYGQSSLNRISNETGGRAFFQGTGAPVSFDYYLKDLAGAFSRQIALTYLSTHPSKGFHKIQITSDMKDVTIDHPSGYTR